MPGSLLRKELKSKARRTGKFGWLLFSLSGLLQACDTQLPIGLDFVEKDPLHVFNIDTVTVKFSTVSLDSQATNNEGRLLIGFHSDSVLGDIEATPFFLLGNDSLPSTAPNAEYSSYTGAVFRLYYDHFWYYDTTQTVSYSLYLLTSELETNEETELLYNTTNFSYDTAAGFLGAVTFTPKPSRNYVEFLVDELFGDSLFQAVVNEEEFLTDDDDFFEKYKGFVLIPEKTNGPMLGFKPSSCLALQR